MSFESEAGVAFVTYVSTLSGTKCTASSIKVESLEAFRLLTVCVKNTLSA